MLYSEPSGPGFAQAARRSCVALVRGQRMRNTLATFSEEGEGDFPADVGEVWVALGSPAWRWSAGVYLT